MSNVNMATCWICKGPSPELPWGGSAYLDIFPIGGGVLVVGSLCEHCDPDCGIEVLCEFCLEPCLFHGESQFGGPENARCEKHEDSWIKDYWNKTIDPGASP